MTREEWKEFLYDALDGWDIDTYNKTCVVADKMLDEHEAQLKAKDKEIDRLEKECEYDQRNAAMSQEESVFLLDELKKERKKARYIVAMLFWMMKRQKAIYVKSFNDLGISNHNTSFYRGAYESSKMRFKQAYVMLKEK